MKKLQIGNVTLDNPIILAPMAGVSDLPFRLLCREMGAALVCMEMVSAKAIYYNNKNTDSLMEIHPDEVPASLQLFGSDPQILAEMAKRIEERPFSILDLNMGCPVPKVVNNGEGSALMKDPKLVEQILTALVRAIGTIIGTIAGAAIGNAVSAPKQEAYGYRMFLSSDRLGITL